MTSKQNNFVQSKTILQIVSKVKQFCKLFQNTAQTNQTFYVAAQQKLTDFHQFLAHPLYYIGGLQVRMAGQLVH